jgi:acetyl esterase/lipase
MRWGVLAAVAAVALAQAAEPAKKTEGTKKAEGAASAAAKKKIESYPIPPTLKNVAYGTHPKQVLHFWRAVSDKPTPLLFFIHGGGWTQGNRSSGLGGCCREC